jgi:hypothetical protein
MRFSQTLFCWERTPAKLVGKCYGIKNGNPIPDNFKAGDTIKLCIHTEELGHVSFLMLMTEDAFATEEVELPNGVNVSTEELWAVYRVEGALDSDSMRKEQVQKTEPRRRTVDALRSESLARSTQIRIGG